MNEPDPRPFGEIGHLPPRLRIPGWLSLLLLAGIAGSALVGLIGGGSLPQRVVRATFYGSAAAYAGVSLVDFAEHFRLEKAVCGRWLAWQAIPPGESINHALTVAILVGLLALARPVGPVPEPRDWITLLAPAAFLILGWRDELVYHRRRASHREDLMHTTAHLAAAVMLCTFVALRLARWD